MFTGIVQNIGQIEDILRKEGSMTIGISTTLNSSHLNLGASIACNGCCLTITHCINHIFYVDVGPETLLLTQFSKLKLGDKVNLEPALKVGDALGGHNVSGHIDGSFQINSFKKSHEDFWKLSLLIPKKFSKFIIMKGSIAVAGISLTIANINSHSDNYLSVEFMVIPHTYSNTILQFISANSCFLEVEFDQSAKTVASLFEGMISNYSQTIQ